ncbi:MAG TPA: low molecular weight protein-tyrosine-phosphatase [Longimicrobiales bacterium]
MSARADKLRILFVCLGNICRSPLAEGVFRHMVHAAGLSDRFEIDSAGTSAYHAGDPPDERASAVARARGVVLVGRSRPIVRADLDRFDYIIVMDTENLHAVQQMAEDAPHVQVRRLREFDAGGNGDLDVPDPYYGGARGFEDVHDMVERGCTGLLEHLRAEHGL